MGQPAFKIDQKAQEWKERIAELVRASKDQKENIALKCFERSMRPYLDDPSTLKTLLGKIKMADIG